MPSTMNSIGNLTIKIGKWASIPLLIMVLIGAFFARDCPPTKFFDMTFGKDCSDDSDKRKANGPAVTEIMLASHNFQGEKVSSLISESKSAVWMFGTSFHQSVQETVLVEAVKRGVDFRYVYLNSAMDKTDLTRIAQSFNQTTEDLKSELEKTFHALKKVYCTLKEKEKHGSLKVRLVNEPIGARMYFFDPFTSDKPSASSDDGRMFLVPYVHGKDSPNLPGFLISGQAYESYRSVAEALWDDEEAKSWEPGECP